MALKNRIDQLIRDEWNKAPAFKELVPEFNSTQSLAQTTQNRSGVNATKFTPERNHVITAPHWVETYAPSNCDKYEYYRYVWMEGQKLRHRHIPGGNIHATRATALKNKVDWAIAQKLSPNAIVEIIKSSTRR